MKWQVVIFPFWLISIYLVALSPALLLAALTYRWNKGLLALLQDPELRTQAPAAQFRAGLWLFLRSMFRLSPPWYGILAFLILALIVHAYQPEKVSALHKLHWMALHLSVEVAAILAALSGTLVFAWRVKTPFKLLLVTTAWVLGLWILIWLITPGPLVEYSWKYTWGERNYTEVPVYPLVLPLYAIVIFLACVYRAGIKLNGWRYREHVGEH
jgi:hypothetical protein